MQRLKHAVRAELKSTQILLRRAFSVFILSFTQIPRQAWNMTTSHSEHLLGLSLLHISVDRMTARVVRDSITALLGWAHFTI